MTDLTAQLRELTDRAAIIDLAVAYAAAVDNRDWDRLATLFADDAHWEYPAGRQRHEGPAAIVAYIGSAIENLDATQHLNGNHVVTVRGDDAEHSCYYHAQHIRRGAEGGDNFLAGGTYHDRLRRTPDGWRFVSRSIRGVWAEGNPAVLGLRS